MPTLRDLTSWKKNEIRHFFQNPYTIFRVHGLDVRLAPSLLLYGRVLIITSARSGKAPERNKFRRRVKTIFYKKNLYESGYDWVIIAKKAGLVLPYPKLESIFDDIVQSL